MGEILGKVVKAPRLPDRIYAGITARVMTSSLPSPSNHHIELPERRKNTMPTRRQQAVAAKGMSTNDGKLSDQVQPGEFKIPSRLHMRRA